jgi:hypothetical protein
MKKYMLLLTVLFVWTGLSAQTEFAPKGAEWYYTCTFGCCPENHFNHIVSEKDTVVEGNDCRILKQYYDHSTVAGEKYIIKQEQGKVYYYYQDRFNLLFDFDAEVNDIVEITFMYREYYDTDNHPFEDSKDTVLSVKYLVEDITVNALNLKTFTVRGIDEIYYGDGIYRPSNRYVYTEKIGLHSEFIPVFDNADHPAVEIYRWLRCYSDAGFSFVSDEWAAMSLPCDYSVATSIDTPKDENSIIYPNPFNDHIFVFANNGGYLEIIDVSGNVVYYSGLSNGINRIPATHFLKGVYFIRIQDKDSGIQTFKTVKS